MRNCQKKKKSELTKYSWQDTQANNYGAQTLCKLNPY